MSSTTNAESSQGKTSKKLFKGMAKIFKKNSNKQLISSSGSHAEGEEDPNELQTLKTIDQRSLNDTDALATEFDHFLAEAQKTIDFTRRTSSTKHAKFNPLVMGDKINQWRAKRKGNVLHDSYTSILAKSDVVENGLKVLTDQSLSDAATLLLQTVSLKIRLQACIDYNCEGYEAHIPFMEALETLVLSLENARHDVMDMLGFLDEVKFLHDNADTPFIPWAMRNSDGKDITVLPLKREILEKRLKRVEKALEKAEKLYKGCRPIHQKMQKDLSHCRQCLSALEHLQQKIEAHASFMSELGSSSTDTREERENPITNSLSKKQRSMSSEGEPTDADANTDNNTNINNNSSDNNKTNNGTTDSNNNASTNVDDTQQISPRTPRSPRTSSQSKFMSPEALFAIALEPFDHAHCSDCALTCLMANDCAMNLAAAQHLAQEGTGRLQKLFEMREKAREKANELDSLDWGESHK